MAIAEQMEDPKLAKGLVKREVIRVVTPGTITSAQALDETKNNYLMGIVCTGRRLRCCPRPTSRTGGFPGDRGVERTGSCSMRSISFRPSEIICNNAFYMSGRGHGGVERTAITWPSPLWTASFFGDESCRKVLREHFRVGSLAGLGLERLRAPESSPPARCCSTCMRPRRATLEHI